MNDRSVKQCKEMRLKNFFELLASGEETLQMIDYDPDVFDEVTPQSCSEQNHN